MSFEYGNTGDAVLCDGCRRIIVGLNYRTMHLQDLTVEHYHEVCWQTGWYTGIAPKSRWPEPEMTVRCTICTSKEHDTPDCLLPLSTEPDPVNHPDHYTWLKNGVEVIDITENFNFLLGNVLKYVMRADHKGKPLEDLKKAVWYLEREIANREAAE